MKLPPSFPPSDVALGAETIHRHINLCAAALNERFCQSAPGAPIPLFLTVMKGGAFFSGLLLPQLSFSMESDYVHVSRYGKARAGSDLLWIRQPQESPQGRDVVFIEDLIDEGVTLSCLRDWALAQGAQSALLCALGSKNKPDAIKADFPCLSLPDAFLFGAGMDIGGLWRHWPEIRIAQPEHPESA